VSAAGGTPRAFLLLDGMARGKVEHLNSTAGALEPMSHLRYLFWTTLAGLVLPMSGLAQTNLTTSPKPIEREGRIVVSDEQALDLGLSPKPIDRQRLSPDIRARIVRFEAIRDAYRKEQDELRAKELGAATEAEREKIRALIKERRDAWLARSRALREETRDRLRELRSQLPTRSEVLDAARESARDAASEIRKRRGTD
jgi:hypothetical protein